MSREDLGSWLEGPPVVGGQDQAYPGQRLGRPEQGPGSVARLGVRAVALVIDWAISLLIASGTTGFKLGTGGASSFAPLLVLFVMSVVLVGTIGSTIGHRIMGMQVVGMNGTYAGPVRAMIRSALLCLAIPALIWDRDQRGLHDKAAGTILLRTR